MNPLAALRQIVTPNIGAGLPNVGKEAAAPANIPARELQQLPSNVEFRSLAPTAAPTEGSFSNVLGQVLSDVNSKQMAASEAMNGVLGGQNVSLHQAMIAMEEASVSF